MSKRFAWDEIRTQYESGIRVRDLMQRFGCSRKAVEIHKKVEQWRKPETMVAVDGRGDGRIGDYERPIVTLANIEEVHRGDWSRMRELHDRAISTARTATSEEALTYARTVRLLLDGMRTIIQGENAAWGVTGTALPLDDVSDAELESEIQAAAERLARARRDGGDTGHVLH